MRIADIRQAAFWEQAICIACGGTVDATANLEPTCEECGGKVFLASDLLDVVDQLENDDEGAMT